MRKNTSLPPNIQILQFVNGLWTNGCLYIAAKYDLAGIIGNERRCLSQITRECRLHPDWAYRILRALASMGIFHESNPQEFENTSLSHCLRSDHPASMRAMVLVANSPRSMVQWANFYHIVETSGVSVPEAIWGKQFYELLDESRNNVMLPVPDVALESRQLFDHMLDTIAPITDQAIIAAYPFLGRICDLGGSNGRLLAAIIQQYPETSGMLFDRAAVMTSVEDQTLELISGDFFTHVPQADIYILKEVFHNWPDAQCALIMKHCRESSPHGTILVIEQLLDHPNNYAPMLDILMGMEQQGRERYSYEYASIAEIAGYRLHKIYQTHSPFTILEFRYTDSSH